jgi:YtkA-like protein
MRVRHAQRRFAHLRAATVTLALAAGVAMSACRPAPPAAEAIDLSWTLTPARPTVGPATLTVTVGEPQAAASGTTVRVVGHMTHPGMAPVVATTTRRGHGVYDATLSFTMAGDWALLVSVQLADGRRLERRIEVRDVRPAA